MSKREFVLTGDGSHTLFLPEMNETYHSTHGAIQESDFVFIQMGLAYFLEIEKVSKVSIFEVGFGTGLNALLSLFLIDSRLQEVRLSEI